MVHRVCDRAETPTQSLHLQARVSFSFSLICHQLGLPRWLSGKESTCQCRRHWRRRLDPWEEPLEEEMAAHSSILAWKFPWTEEPGGLQSTGSQRVKHDWALTHSDRRKWSDPVTLAIFCSWLENHWIFSPVLLRNSWHSSLYTLKDTAWWFDLHMLCNDHHNRFH